MALLILLCNFDSDEDYDYRMTFLVLSQGGRQTIRLNHDDDNNVQQWLIASNKEREQEFPGSRIYIFVC